MSDNSPEDKRSTGGDSDNPSAEQQNIAIAINALNSQYKAAQGQRAEQENKIFRWTRGAAIGVFIYTTLTSIITSVSIYAANQARISADEARRQADAAESQIAVARDTEIRQLRAYVVVDSPNAILANGIPILVAYQPNNVGQSPAKEVSFFGRAFLAESRLAAFNLPALDIDSINNGAGILNPSAQFKDAQTSVVRVRPDITTEQWEERQKFAQSRLIAFGEVIYKDVFDIERHTWWCVMSGGHALTPGKFSLTGPWEPCLRNPGKLPPNRFD